MTACLTGGLSVSADANEPLSAIPWLSKDASAPSRPLPRPQAYGPKQPATIEVSVLAPVAKASVGLLAPEATGLPYDLWKGMSELRARKLISETPITGVPATRDLFGQILLARAKAPSGSAGGDTLLVARIDRLIQKGRLEAAAALIDASGAPSPDVFARSFDIALINDRADRACSILKDQPDLAPNDQTRVMCLIMSDDWQGAEAALDAATSAGSIPEATADLLARFLDPEEGETAPPPRRSGAITPLDYVLRDSFGFPVPRTGLPLALRHIGLSGRAGLRERILAAEALTAARAIPANLLFAAYRDSRPAASGGAWERARATQDLDAAVMTGEVEDALAAALDQIEHLGLLTAFAEEYGPQLTQGADSSQAVGLLKVLSGDFEGPSSTNWTQNLRQAHALGQGKPMSNPSSLFQAAFDGLNGTLPDFEPAKRMRELFDAERIGEALLKALKLLSVGNEIDPDDLQTALFAISQAGLHDIALQIAVQTLVLEDVI